MAIVALLAFLVPAAFATFAFVRGLTACSALWQMIRRPTTPLGDARDGPVEVEGTLRVVGEPLIAVSGARCAALTVHATRVERAENKKKRHHVREASVRRLAACVLEDERGARLELGPEVNVSIQGDAFVAEDVDPSALSAAWRADLVRGPADSLILEEHRIDDGARVVVHGIVEQTTGETTAYRKGEKRVLVSPNDQPMLVWKGSEPEARRKALWLCAAITLCVAALIDLSVKVLRAF